MNLIIRTYLLSSSQGTMFPWSNVPLVSCSQGPMLPGDMFPLSKEPLGPMFPGSFTQRALCLVKSGYNDPRVPCFLDPVFQRFYVHRVLHRLHLLWVLTLTPWPIMSLITWNPGLIGWPHSDLKSSDLHAVGDLRFGYNAFTHLETKMHGHSSRRIRSALSGTWIFI